MVGKEESLEEFERWAKMKANFYEWQMRSADSSSMMEVVEQIEEFRRIIGGLEPEDPVDAREMAEWEKKGCPYTIDRQYDDV
jgi:hypothetical protein